jgi:hypothetical protein
MCQEFFRSFMIQKQESQWFGLNPPKVVSNPKNIRKDFKKLLVQ